MTSENKPTAAPAVAALHQYPIATTFGVQAPTDARVPGLAPGLPGVPNADPYYVFELERLRQIIMFWVGGFKALMIEGDPASGKTSIIEQYHARLNVPLAKFSCANTTESAKLIGQLYPTPDKGLKWVDGPVLQACRQGTSVLLDEYNLLDPGEASSLNMLLEGYSITIPETGEVIGPKPTTRFFVAQNAVDSRLMVAGRNVQDVANDDRFSYMRVDYLSADLETALVIRQLVAGGIAPELAQTVAGVCVTVANKVRAAYKAGDADIEKPLSTRAVLRWAKYSVMYLELMKRQNRSGIHYAIGQAVRMPETMAAAVNTMITMVAGYGESLI